MAEDKTNMYLIAVVAIVAVVGLVVLFTNKSVSYPYSGQQAAGEKVRIDEQGVIYDMEGKVIGDAEEGVMRGEKLTIIDEEGNLVGQATVKYECVTNKDRAGKISCKSWLRNNVCSTYKMKDSCTSSPYRCCTWVKKKAPEGKEFPESSSYAYCGRTAWGYICTDSGTGLEMG